MEPRNRVFNLPPPPTRSRRIIQMNPGSSDDVARRSSSKGSVKGRSTKAFASEGGSSASESESVSGKTTKQSGKNAAVSKKTAKRTAHRLIERQRRSKMNEEFDVLKSLIPACTGEMHKLAILQASIEYINYLEDCIVKLKEHNDAVSSGLRVQATLPSIHEFHPSLRPPEDFAGDVEMTEPEPSAASSFIANPESARQHSRSPAPPPASDLKRRFSYSAMASTAGQRQYSYSASPSISSNAEQLGPEDRCLRPRSSTASSSPLNESSPRRQFDTDQRSNTALLLPNSGRRKPPDGDRGGGRGGGGGGGFAVRDLLSS